MRARLVTGLAGIVAVGLLIGGCDMEGDTTQEGDTIIVITNTIPVSAPAPQTTIDVTTGNGSPVIIGDDNDVDIRTTDDHSTSDDAAEGTNTVVATP